MDDRMSEDWMTRAACKGLDTNVFFPDEQSRDPRANTHAKAICATCPVLSECADWAITFPPHVGIVGGMDYHERQRYRKNWHQRKRLARKRAEREAS